MKTTSKEYQDYRHIYVYLYNELTELVNLVYVATSIKGVTEFIAEREDKPSVHFSTVSSKIDTDSYVFGKYTISSYNKHKGLSSNEEKEIMNTATSLRFINQKLPVKYED